MNKVQFDFGLTVDIIREDNSFIAYSPALDLSTVGKTFEEAKKRFEEAVQIFFEEIKDKGTLAEVLSELGWQDRNGSFIPPTVISHETEQFSIPHVIAN